MRIAFLIISLTLFGCGSSDGPGGTGGTGGDAGTGGVGASGGSGGSAGAAGSGGSGGEAGTGGTIDPTERVVFVTTARQTADLGGFEGADGICAAEATAAGLEGEFKAWLSTLDVAAADRLVQSTVPYVLVDGTRIADDWDDLVDNALLAPIDVDATGERRTGDVWTGTLPDGQPYPDGDCAGFTSATGSTRSLCGSTASAGSAWSAAQTPTCNTSLRLYCFEQ